MTDHDSLGLSPEFLEIAACPACHGEFAVDYEASELVCTAGDCGLRYPVVDGIPVLLVDQAKAGK